MILVCMHVSHGQAEEVTREQIRGLDEQVQDIKKDVIDLTADLNRLEEKLLFPSNTQFSLFVSIHEDKDFRLDSVQVKLDNQVVAYHLYTFRELEALQKGGVQKLYTGNVRTGEHNLVISYSGKLSSGGDYKRSATHTFSKEAAPAFVEMKLGGPDADQEGVSFRDW